jgi:hypothetical protein
VIWLAWATYRETRRATGADGELSLAEIADQLAIAVGAQWQAETAVRRLNDPYPLPVSWVAADASLSDNWDALVKLATSGAGWPALSAQVGWASGPDDLVEQRQPACKGFWSRCRRGAWWCSASLERASSC